MADEATEVRGMRQDRCVSQESIDELIRIAGPLPDWTFETTIVNDEGKFEDVSLAAREKIVHAVESAALAYHRAKHHRPPTAAQLLDQFSAIESAATRLLHALQVGRQHDIDTMPEALRYGLQVWAAHEADSPAARSNRELAGRRLREAIEGVVAVQQWAKRAREQTSLDKQREARRRAAIGNPKARNKGDSALNEYLMRVIVDCWCAVYSYEEADGPQLLSFAMTASKAVGVPLGKEAARERLRRMFGWRKTGKSKTK